MFMSSNRVSVRRKYGDMCFTMLAKKVLRMSGKVTINHFGFIQVNSNCPNVELIETRKKEL